MQIAATILGLLGGILGLVTGWFFYAAGELGRGAGVAVGGTLFHLLVPLAGIVGAALSIVNPVLAACMMVGSGALMVALLGFGTFSAASVLLLVLAGLLLLTGTPEGLRFVRVSADRLPAARGAAPGDAFGIVQAATRLGRAVGGRNAFASDTAPTMMSQRNDLPTVPDLRLRGQSGRIDLVLPGRKLASGGVTVGRADNCDVTLSDQSISRMHARLHLDNAGRLVVEDLGSANGTWLAGRRIDRAVVLQPGAVLRLGDLSFVMPR